MPTDDVEDIDTNEDSGVDADTVIVTLSENEPEPEADDITVEEGDTTVIVTNDDSSDPVTAVVVEETINQAVAIAELSGEIAALRERVVQLEIAAIVEESHEESLEEEIDEIPESEEEEPEDDEPDSGELDILPPSAEPKSAKAHPLFRPFSDWKRD